MSQVKQTYSNLLASSIAPSLDSHGHQSIATIEALLLVAIIMGFHCGFDLSPPIQAHNSTDTDKWARFITAVLRHYEPDSENDYDTSEVDILDDKGFIEFCVGEHPTLPYDGSKFRRFSSKISGYFIYNAEPVIREVARIAKEVLGDRASFWHELEGEDDEAEHGVRGMRYDWQEVNESLRTYGLDFEAQNGN